MAKIIVEANQCDVCGHVWLPTGKVAVQCAKCRTRKWNAGKVSSIQPVGGGAVFMDQQRYTVHGAHPSLERTIEYEE